MAVDREDKRDDGRDRRLAAALRTIKIAAADRSDVVVDMKEADLARLELLAQELQTVFDDVPHDDDRFDFAISSGLQPRLWIDVTAHVMMGRDRRTYVFVRDTRRGRIILAESASMEPVAEAVALYIAEKLYEREKEMNGDIISLRRAPAEDDVVSGGQEAEGRDAAPSRAADIEQPRPQQQRAHVHRTQARDHVAEDEQDARSMMVGRTATVAEPTDRRSRSLLNTGGTADHTPAKVRRRYPVYESQSVADPDVETSLGLLLAILAGLFVVGGGFIWLFRAFAG